MMPTLGMRPLWSVNVRQILPTGLNVVPSTLLLVGGIGCLSLRAFGRPVMIAYAVAAMLMVLLGTGFLLMRVVTGEIMGSLGSRERLGYLLYFGLGMVPGAAMPVIVPALMTRPQVKHVFR
jgi:hypothetical protein